MSATLRPFIAAIAISLLLLAACEQEDAAPSQSPPSVNYVTLRPQPVTLTRELPGRTSAYVVAEVRPQVTGIVKERLFDEGALVEQGQPLYQLDDSTYRAAWNAAKASLARAKAAAEVARLNAERAEELIKVNAVSKQEYDNLGAALRQAEADVGVAEAQVVSTAVELEYARITSPIDGRAGKSTVTRGALVTADQAQVLTTVQQLDPIYVDLNQSSSELLELRRALADKMVRKAEGVPVTIILEDGRRYEHEGELTFADVAVDPMTGSYALRAVVPNPDHLLMPGMYLRAVVTSAVVDHVLLVPQQGIARDPQGNASAMLLTDENKVEQRAVTAQRTVGNDWLISSGLSAGDRVIVEGLQKIRPGMQAQGTEVALHDEDLEPATPRIFDPDAPARSSAAPVPGSQ